MNNEKETYTIAEIAKKYQVEKQTVYNWIKAGMRTTLRQEKGRRIIKVATKEDVDEFLVPTITKTVSKMETVDQ